MLNAEIMQDAEQRRLAWRCRRGMLELDIVLQRFVKEQFAGLTLAEMRIFDEMLELSDNDFWELMQSATQVSYEPDVQNVLNKLNVTSQKNTHGEAFEREPT